MIEMKDIESLLDLDELFEGIWAAVEYGNDKQQYKEQILKLCNDAARQTKDKGGE